MACTISAEDIKRVKAQGFLNNKGTDLFNGRIITVNGRITPDQALVIAQAAKLYGTAVEFTSRMTVEIQGIHYDNIADFQAYIAQAGLYTGGTGAQVRPVVSCKGTTCQYGLYDTFDLSEKMHHRFYEEYHGVKLPHKFKIAVGGCPNNCVKPSLNDFGVVGQLRPNVDLDACKGCKKCKIEENCPMKAAKVVEGKISIDKSVCTNCGRCVGKCPFKAFETGTQGYLVQLGGRWGKRKAEGNAVHKLFTQEGELLDFLETVILYFRDKGIPGERFNDTINRIGFATVEQELLSGDCLRRKEEILKD